MKRISLRLETIETGNLRRDSTLPLICKVCLKPKKRVGIFFKLTSYWNLACTRKYHF